MEKTGRPSREGRGGGHLVCGRSPGEPDFLLRWGNRKRLRCVKIQVRDEAAQRTTTRDPSLRRRASSPRRILGYNTRNLEASAVMKAQQHQQQQQGTNGGCLASPEGPRGNKKGADNGASMLAEVAPKDNRKVSSGEGGSPSSGSYAAVWPNVVIALTTREKEEDFLAFKGTKLPQRPKKRAKLIQRTLNQVSPGSWLCDLTLERYEVREKKVTRKIPRGLKAMGSFESESE